MSRKIFVILLVLLLALTFALVGCGNDANQSSNEQNYDSENTKIVNGIKMDKEQYLNFAIAEPKSLDSTKTSSNTSWYPQTPIFEGLTRVQGTPEGIDKIEPGVAESWEVSEDGLVYTFHLRKNAKWSDGKPVTAYDFEYAWKRLLDPNTASPYQWFLKPLIKGAADFAEGKGSADDVGITAVDNYTFRVELVAPCPYFMQLTYYPVLKPIRKDIAEKYGDKYGTEADTIVCNGPYVLTEWVHRGKMVWEKNPYYWDKEHVYIEKITNTVIEDTNAYLQALYKGDIDSGGTSKKEWRERLEKTGKFNFIERVGADCDYIMFNANDRYFKNAKIRKAFSAAFDRVKLSNDVNNGRTIPAEEYIPSTFVIGNENYVQKVGGNKFVKKLQEDVKDPKALLIEGLKELGEDPDPAKMEVSFLFRGNDEWTKKCAEWFKQAFDSTLGIDLKLELLKWNIAFNKVDNGEFQMYYGGWFGDFNDPATMLEYWHSKEGYYKIGWSNEEFDSLIDEARSLADNDRRAEIYKRCEEILVYEDAIIAPINHSLTTIYRRKYIKNMYNPLFGYNDYKGVYTLGRE
ncbi:peptide ABC transporter substrate-binding protein [Caloranaerobacter azorensis]|uniref:Peptide ABC transporter substrate-binding protein n=1 Tax=Caloranaerobacter azorensis TaxID=116090 RepID=A0A6P1YD79_9FIRM|nr:peptide ABC transporter substrate-binding protein [Caloranaerobacter azorensis]QIB27027.1 peptide ABC transporter substrate-binding protein [Caloranaerobacter azorensis]